jgi:hypothetical protein
MERAPAPYFSNNVTMGGVMGPPSLLRAETKVILIVKQSAVPVAMGALPLSLISAAGLAAATLQVFAPTAAQVVCGCFGLTITGECALLVAADTHDA